MAAPILTTEYGNQGNELNDVVNLDLNTNWSGATTVTAENLPATLSIAAGVVTGTVTAVVGRNLVTVTASNTDGENQAQFFWSTVTQTLLPFLDQQVNMDINDTINRQNTDFPHG